MRRPPGNPEGEGKEESGFGPALCGEEGRAARPEGNGSEGVGVGRALQVLALVEVVGQVTGLGAAEEKPRKWGRVGVGGVNSESGVGGSGG